MKIVLMRHGKPDVPELGKLRAGEIRQWIETYNAADLISEYQPSTEAMQITASCNAVVCSNLPRSVGSAKLLNAKEINHCESLFREMELPYASWPSPKLPPYVWVALFRIFSFFGYSSNGESIRIAKCRAISAASKLKELADDKGSVLLIGHGFLNRFIAKELLSSDWQGPKNPGKKFWEFGVYEYIEK